LHEEVCVAEIRSGLATSGLEYLLQTQAAAGHVGQGDAAASAAPLSPAVFSRPA
jgi:hypothetical protein